MKKKSRRQLLKEIKDLTSARDWYQKGNQDFLARIKSKDEMLQILKVLPSNTVAPFLISAERGLDAMAHALGFMVGETKTLLEEYKRILTRERR